MKRRELLLASAGLLLSRGARAVSKPGEQAAERQPAGGDELSPTEDLMREHGLLNRVLLVYDECARRLEQKSDLPREVLPQAASLIQRFIEQYHEKLEEEHLFPRLEKAGRLGELTAILRTQHAAGRKLTAELLSGPIGPGLVRPLRAFVRMYRPHEAREDTVLFPAFRALVGKKDLERLGDAFEEREHQLFGARGYERNVDEVGKLEAALGLADLAQFTPRP